MEWQSEVQPNSTAHSGLTARLFCCLSTANAHQTRVRHFPSQILRYFHSYFSLNIEIFSSLDFQIFFHRYWYTFLLGYPAISLPQSLERKILYCKVFCLEGLSNDIVVNAQQYLMIGPSFIKQVSSGKIPLTIWTSCTVPSTSYSNWTQIFLTTWTLLKVNPDHV